MQFRNRYDFRGSGPGGNSVVEEAVKFPLKILWKSKNLYAPGAGVVLSEQYVIASSTTLYKGGIVNRKISAFTRDEGTLCWEVPLDNLMRGGGMCLYRDMVIVCDHITKSVVAVRDGEILWRTVGIAFSNSIHHYGGEVMVGAIKDQIGVSH